MWFMWVFNIIEKDLRIRGLHHSHIHHGGLQSSEEIFGRTKASNQKNSLFSIISGSEDEN
jgi:hypothetical protein